MNDIAATVTGTFTLIDKASGPLERIQRQARKTDRAIRGLSDRLDKIGRPQQLQRMERTDRALANLNRTGGKAGTVIDRNSRSMDRASRSAKTLTDRLVRTGQVLTGLGKVATAGKLILLASAIGVAAQAVTVLSAGAVALIPRLVDLGGAAAVLPAVFTGVGLAVVASKLAFKDLDKAMGGNKEAIKALTPEARQFLDTLKSFQPVVKDLRRSAQQGLFPGLDAALGNLRRGVPMARGLLNRAGAAAGTAATRATEALTKPQALRDLNRVGNQGVRVFDRMTRGGISLMNALIDVTVAAEPFTDWLSKAALRLTRVIEAEAQAGRESGRLARFFNRTRDALQQMGEIGGNLWGTLRNVGRASRSLGDDLWQSIEGTTERWEKWTGSLRGQSELRRWFAQARAPLHELAGLVGDLAKAVFRFDTGGLTETIRSLRDAVPSLARFFEAMAQSGPAIAGLFSSLADLASNLGGVHGALATLLATLTGVLDVTNDLIEAVPAFGTVMVAALTVAGASKLGRVLAGIAASWGMVGRAAATAGAAQATAGIGAAAGTTAAGTVGAAMGRRGALRAERALMRSSGINPNSPGALRGQAGTLAGGLASRVGGGAILGGFGAQVAGGAVGGVGGSMLSGAGMGAVVGGTVGSLVPVVGTGIGAGVGALIGGGMGIVSGRRRQATERQQSDEASLQQMLGGMQMGAGGVGGTTSQIARLQRARGMAVRERSGAGQRSLTDAIDAEIRARRDMLPLLRQERAARSRTRGAEQGEQIQRAFRTDVRHGGPASAMRNLRSNVLGPGGISGRDFPGARQVAQQSLAMAREAARGNPKLQKEYDRLERGVRARFDAMGNHVVVVNGKILSATARDWPRIRERITQPAEQARERASRSLSGIQRAAIGALRDMGYGQKEAAGIVRGAHAAGGNLPRNPAGDRNVVANTTAQANAGRPLGGVLGGPAVGAITGPSGDGIGDGIGNRDMGGRGGRRRSGAPGLMGASVGLAPYASDAASYGLSVTSGLRPGSITNSGNLSHHASGSAIDLAGPAPAMLAFASHAASAYGSQLEELIYSPLRFSIKNGQRVAPYAVADHFDHVHLADKQAAGVLAGAGAGGAMGGTGLAVGGVSLNAPRSGVQGVAGALADTAMAAMTTGLEQRINERIGGTGLAMPAAGVGATGGIAAMIAAVGLPPIFNAIIAAESGGNVRARNPSGASGLSQIMMPLHAGLVQRYGGNVFDPMTNLRVAKHLYDESGLAPWTASRGVWGRQGDGVGWGGMFGDGGSMRVRKPTLFMAGDRGDETVRVQRSTQRGGRRGGGIVINGITVHNYRDGDIEAQIRDEVDRALAEYGDELDGAGVEDDGALLA